MVVGALATGPSDQAVEQDVVEGEGVGPAGPSDQAIAELYAIAREAFAGGQPAFQFQAYPFRMRAENFAKHRADPNIAFWRNLTLCTTIRQEHRWAPTLWQRNHREAEPGPCAARNHCA